MKIYIHVFAPVSAVFILNNLVLLTLETPGYLITNLISFTAVLTVSIFSLRDINKKGPSKENEVLDKTYADLKILLGECCQKESLPIAKEIARICSDLGPYARVEPKKSPFKQGSLRNAYKMHSEKIA
jgi:hypothetical protein